MLDRDNFRPSQEKLLGLLTEFECGIIVLGCGGGKTVSSLTAVVDLMEEGELDYAVVLAPVKVVANVWPKEPYRWSHLHGANVVPLLGPPARRKQLIEKNIGEPSIFVCSHDNTTWLVDVLLDLDLAFDRTMLVIDEISKFKDPASVRRKKLQTVAPRFDSRWGLTGTPRPNGYEDLFVPLKLIAGEDVWGVRDYDTWRETFFVKQDYHGFVYKVNDLLVDKLDAIAGRFMFHLPDGDLNVPETREGEDFDRWVKLTDLQAAAYQDMVDELIVELGTDDEAVLIEAMSQGVASGKLTQIAQGFMYFEEEGDRLCHRFDPNPKMTALRELLEEIGGDNVMIAYHYREELEALQKELGRKTPNLGAGTSAGKTDEIIEAWGRGKIPRLLVHPASMGHGTDGLQHGGHHLIWYHPTWSAEIAHQTVSRLDRPGQKHPVRNWRILAEDTNDEIKDARVHNKDLDAAAFLHKLRKV